MLLAGARGLEGFLLLADLAVSMEGLWGALGVLGGSHRGAVSTDCSPPPTPSALTNTLVVWGLVWEYLRDTIHASAPSATLCQWQHPHSL